jgi:hypothetical protein
MSFSRRKAAPLTAVDGPQKRGGGGILAGKDAEPPTEARSVRFFLDSSACVSKSCCENKCIIPFDYPL